MSHNDVLDTSRLCFEGDFATQVAHILQEVRLNRVEVENLRILFSDLENALQYLAQGCEVMPFGSIITGLGIKTSDADCYVQLPNGMTANKNIVVHARNILHRNRTLFTNLLAITQCKVPIVKFLHIPTNCNCDVSFKSPAGVRNSELIGHMLHRDCRALPLAVLIKYWSKVHRFTGTNLMANYALTLLVIFYLQIQNILPSVYELQKNIDSVMVENWDTAFNENLHHTIKNTQSLYSLLGGFFKYYSHFDFEQSVISPFMGKILSRKLFVNIQSVPEEYALYKHNVYANICPEMRIDSGMCVQDPFEHSRNCTVAIFPKLMARILAHFRFAAKKFEENPEDCFLKAIFTEDPNILKEANIDKAKHVSHNKIHKQRQKQNRMARGYQGHLKIMYTEFKKLRKGKR